MLLLNWQARFRCCPEWRVYQALNCRGWEGRWLWFQVTLFNGPAAKTFHRVVNEAVRLPLESICSAHPFPVPGCPQCRPGRAGG